MADRKLELERKKAKLAAMREEKKKREDEKRRGVGDASTPGASSDAPDLRTEAEDILKNLGIPMNTPQPAPGSVAATVGGVGVAAGEGDPSTALKYVLKMFSVRVVRFLTSF